MIARAMPVLDTLRDGHRVAIMVGDQVVLLGEMASEVWEALRSGPTTLAALGDALVTRYGPPNGEISPEMATHRILTELASNGLVELSDTFFPDVQMSGDEVTFSTDQG